MWSGLFIPDPDTYFFCPILDPGFRVKKAPGPVSGSVTVL